jgi:hypothetical protein
MVHFIYILFNVLVVNNQNFSILCIEKASKNVIKYIILSHFFEPLVLFECKIIDKNISGISSLVMSYISSHANDCMIDGSNTACIMEKYDLIPNNIIDLYNDTKKNISFIKEKHKTYTNYLDYPYQNELLTKMKNRIGIFKQKYVTTKQNLEENKTILGTQVSRVENRCREVRIKSAPAAPNKYK